MKVSSILVALSLLCTSAASAQEGSAAAPVTPESPAMPEPPRDPDAAKAEASEHFRRGVELYQEEAFRAAMVEFQRAYDIAPDYRLLYNIGQTKLEIQDYLGAAEAYERYLAEGGAEITPERRRVVEDALGALRERVGSISIKVNRDNALVYIDDVHIGKTPLPQTIRVNVGRHRIAARGVDGSSDAKVIDVAGGDIAEVSLTLTDLAVSVVREDPPWTVSEKAAVATWSAGGALLAGGLVTGLLANKAESDLTDMLEQGSGTRSELSDKRNSAKVLGITTDVLIATGAASAVAGTLLWIFGGHRERAPDQQPAATSKLKWGVGMGSLSVSGQF